VGDVIMINYELKYSLTTRGAITIIYMKGIDIIQRNIQVIKIEDDKVIAFDIDKKGIRSFKKENILSAMENKLIYNNFRETKESKNNIDGGL